MAKNLWKKISIKTILVFSFIIRLVLLPWTYHGDITVTYWWGKFATEFGWRGYYDWLNFGGYGRPDQPMINIIYDWSVRVIYNFFYQILWFLNVKIPAFPSKFMQWYFLNGNQVLLKVPMIIADIFLIYFVYRFVAKNFSTSKAKIAAVILALYPPLIYNSAIWGSGDSIINLFALLGIFFLYQKKYLKFVLFFLISILYKSSLIIWIPVVLTILIYQRTSLKNLNKMALFSGLLIYLVSRPFAIQNTLVWFYLTITQKILPGAMPQITANAMNFWALIFGLKPRLDELMILNVISIRNLSLLLCLILYSLVLIRLYKNYSSKNILLALVQITLITFTFMTRMHERYTFPALVPLLVLCIYDRRFYKYFILISFTHLLNVYNWWWVPKFPLLINFLKQDLSIRLISLTNLLIILKLLAKNVQK
ncbi:MAG: hypothetical protein WC503_00010 [Candidatus Shapirobacteria bacterium]